jgi:hypothetical protein
MTVSVPPFFALSGGAVGDWNWDGTRFSASSPPPPPPHDAKAVPMAASATTGMNTLSHLNRIFIPFLETDRNMYFSVYSIKSSLPAD